MVVKMVGGLGLGSQARPFLRLTLFVCLLAFLSVFYFFSDVTSVGYLEFVRRTSEFETDFYYNTGPATYLLDPSDNLTHAPREGYLVWNPSCRIPDIDPWHESIRHLIHRTEPLVCSTLPPLTRITGHTLQLIHANAHLYGGEKSFHCCYQEISRRDADKFDPKVDDIFSVGQCIPFVDTVNLTSEQQFIMVKCVIPRLWKNKEVYTNLHAVVPVRKDIKEKLQDNLTPDRQRMSVLIVGIDSISRLNLIRTMPKTVDWLQKMGWVEMKGYNKIDDNTFPNVMAILTGMNYTQVRNECMFTNKNPVDECPFIWKNFSEQGYVTAYGEDEPVIGTFNYQKTGFFKTPTDYYLRPFMLAAEKNTVLKRQDGLKICLGPTLSTDHIYKYATDFATTFRNNLYFALFWMNTLSHNNVNTPSALDSRTLKFLQDLTHNGVLNNTLVVFLSDHGMRFGKIRQTYVGWLEERLPFIFMWMPEWYRKLFPMKYANLLDNREKLTSPFDLHLTLQEVLHGEHDNGTRSCPDCVSMFDEVPWNRSCRDVGVTEHWCTCSEYRTLSTEGNSVRSMVRFTVGEINRLLEDGREMLKNNTRCAKLTVKRVLSVRSKVYERKLGYDEYVVLFETLPGQALFEATVGHSGQFKLLGSVSRINTFGSESKCVLDAILKKYCYCIKS
ncbi:hypothetical protein J6590_039844 [Homalodisca vitripennis]|nr:hypothetical protein J6590_039844 [Homalodisca vitripennis]